MTYFMEFTQSYANFIWAMSLSSLPIGKAYQEVNDK